MQPKRPLSISLTVPMVVAIIVSLVTATWAAPKYRVLHAFTGGNDGGGLWGSLLLDKQGNVYGATSAGGPNGGGGTVFKLTPRPNGTWSDTVLYGFCNLSNCTDGGGSTAGLVFDASGNLYGTTKLGGTHAFGTVFELTSGTAGWVETVLYSFPEPPSRHGCCPYAGLVMDKTGDLYGTAGYPFVLRHGSEGWQEKVLHFFNCQHNDGCVDLAGVILDDAGNLFGPTEMGGSSKNCGGGCGTVFELRHLPDGKWKDTILHSFGSPGDGAFPGVGALTMDSSGSLYGTTDIGGPNGGGTVFKLTLGSDGHWKETILHSFTQGADGDHVSTGVVMDKAGNLYGTTIGGGGQCGCGVVYKLAPSTNGKWTYTVLHRFTGYDGAQPDANLILDDKGNLYGTTATGGAGGAGVAFEITP